MVMNSNEIEIDGASSGTLVAFHLNDQSIASDGADSSRMYSSIRSQAQNFFRLFRFDGKKDTRLTLPEQQCIATQAIKRQLYHSAYSRIRSGDATLGQGHSQAAV